MEMMATIKGTFEFEEGQGERQIGKIFTDLCLMFKNDVANITVSNETRTLTNKPI